MDGAEAPDEGAAVHADDPAVRHHRLQAAQRLAVVHAIEDRRVFAALEHLGSFVRRCFEEGPGSIDPDLFWFRDGRFTRLSFVPGKDGALHFTPSAEFGAVLDQLGDPA